MADRIEVCEGATIGTEEIERVAAAMAELAKDPHAPREISVKVTLHIHNEYPKMLYRGKETKSVANEKAEAAAEKEGFGPYEHKVFNRR